MREYIMWIAALMVLIAALPVSAQTYCYGANCDPVGNDGGMDGNTYDFSEQMLSFAINQSIGIGSFSPERIQCYRECKREFESKKDDCKAAILGFSPTTEDDEEAYGICEGVAREEYIGCLGVTGLQTCNREFPD